MSCKFPFLVSLAFLFCGCVKDDFDADNHLVAEDLCKSLERYSVSILRPDIDYQYLKGEYQSSVNNEMIPEEFFSTTKNFLLNFSDPHIWLHSPFEKMYSIDYLNYTRNISFETVETYYLDNVKHHATNIISGTINESIGYLYISDFKGEEELIKQMFNAIIDGFSDKKGLIIDIRENDGGSVYNAQSLLNKLTDQRRLWHTTQNKIEGGFDKKYDWYINPAGNFQFIDNIIVLIGRYTISAGERFAIGAKILPNIKVIGDTTANTQGAVMGREMINGWKYTFTFEKCLAPDGTNYEGIGIAPDVYFKSDELDFSSSDELIDLAISELQ